MIGTTLPKLRQSVRFKLLGAYSVDPSFAVALDALSYIEEISEGKFRADGITPELIHPLSVTALLMTLQPALLFPADTFTAALLHDSVEDLGVSVEYIRERFGIRPSHAVRRVSKVVHGVKVPSLTEHFLEMGDCPIGTVLKGADRAVNLSTMNINQFSAERQLKQATETEEYILPMLKAARKRFAQQEPAYENLKFILMSQVRLLRLQHGALQET